MDPTFESITRSLGRTSVQTPSAPPSIDPKIARLVHSGADLVALFRQRAGDAKMKVIDAAANDVARLIAEQLVTRGCRTILYTDSPLMQRINLGAAIASSGIDVKRWTESTLDASYDVDAGVTDVWRAVAETGSIVVKESTAHGRAVSLVPPIHLAIVQMSQIVPDLLDLMTEVQREGSASGIVIITGPSKTADIEMNLVVGVHGPGEVVIFLVE